MRKIGKWKNCWSLVTIAMGFAGACLWAQEGGGEPLRTRVYALHYITTAQGQAYLEKLKLGTTVSQVPQSNALIVTALPIDLVKTTSLLEIVDSKQTFVIDRLGAADMNLPSVSAITAQLDGVSVGTFLDPPSRTKKSPAILDVLNGNTILVSPEGKSDAIIKAIMELKAAKETAQAVPQLKTSAKQEAPAPKVEDMNKIPAGAAEPTLPAESNEEEMLNKEVSQLLSRPNQPPVVPKEAAPKPAVVEPPKPKETVEAAPAETEPVTESMENVTGEIEPVSMEPNFIPHGQEVIQLQLPETVDVIALLDLVGRYLNVNFMYDPAKVNGQVTLKIRGTIKVSELYALTESVLKFKGFAMSRRGNLVTVVPAGEALTIDPLLKTDTEKVMPGDMVVTSVYNLKYVNVANATALLTNMKLGTSVNSVVETNTLIVTDFGYRMDRVDRLLAMIDQPGAPRQFKFRQLKYTLASTLAPKIQEVAQQIGSETINVQVGATTTTGPGGARPGMRGRPGMPGQPGIPGQPGQPAGAQAGQPTVYLNSDERTNRLLMVGQEKDLNLINELVDTFDVPQQDLRSIKEYEIQYVDAREITDTLTTLGIISGAGLGTQGTRGGQRIQSPQMAQQQPQPGLPGGASLATASPNEEPQIAILEATNSLLVNATPEQQAAVVMVISYVDRQPAEVAIPYMVYPLEFQKPSELKTALSELIEKTIKDEKGKITQTVSRGEDITIVADDKAFSLIVYANRKNQEWVGSLIRQLDKKRPQVLIDVTLVEITRTDQFDYEMRIAAASQPFDANGTRPFQVPLIAPAAGGQHAREAGSGPGQGGTAIGGGQFFYSDQSIQALLTAVQQKSYGRVLAKPKILVNDNEDGKISTTQTTYRAQSTTQVPTTGPTVTSTTYQSYDATIELNIKPHISEGDLLLLEVKMKREDFALTADQAQPPNKTASNVDSKVLVPDGATIILGGMIKLNQSKGGSKVPILGDLPLIGILFRGIHDSDTESKLYIFVKAYALRPVEGKKGLPQAQEISNENRAAFEKAERTFQNYHDVPGIKAKPMEPNNVLDEL